MKRLRAALPLLLLSGCADNLYYTRSVDTDVQTPVDLDVRLRRFRSGEELWHADPKTVADIAIRTYKDVPWKADPFNPRYYEVLFKPEWGTYVTRGYRYPSGGEMRYRVKLRKHEEIWYPVQVSHYKVVERPEDKAHTLDHHH